MVEPRSGSTPQIQAARGTAPTLPARPGQAERRSHDYRRHGTLDPFAALDVKAGAVIGACERRHRSAEFRAFLDRVGGGVPPDAEVHLVLDNLKTHKARLIHDRLVKRPRFHPHFTPTSLIPFGAQPWPNLVECRFALLSRRRLERGAFTSTADLGAAIHAHIAETNAEPKPFVRTRTADLGPLRGPSRASVARLRQQTSNSDH